MQRRLHPRVRLQLPARLRWSEPLAQQTEQCQTINVSRGGLLLRASHSLRPGHPLWVAFPFAAESSGAQPETVARVVRCAKSDEPGTAWCKLAVKFEAVREATLKEASLRKTGNSMGHAGSANGNGSDSARTVSLPIHVRQKGIPWYEEVMTIEVSADKLKFQTCREYQFGEHLMVSFDRGGEELWKSDGESEAEVTGIEMAAGSDSVMVTVRRKP